MNDHDDLSPIDFGSTMKNKFFFKYIFWNQVEKEKLTSNNNANE